MNRVRELRKSKNMTTQVLGEALGLSQQYISDIENGRATPSLKTLNKIAEYFNVSTDYLLGKTDAPYFDAKKAGEIIKRTRESSNISIKDAANKIGVSKSYLTAIEDGQIKNQNILMSFAEIFGLSKEQILERILESSPIDADNYSIKIPILSTTHDNQLLFAKTNTEGYIPTDKQFILTDNEYFYLRIKDDSMSNEFKKGSLVLVQKQDHVESGDLGAVIVNDSEAIIRQVFIKDQLITLMPQSDNQEFQPQIYDISRENVRIIGKVILAIKKY